MALTLLILRRIGLALAYAVLHVATHHLQFSLQTLTLAEQGIVPCSAEFKV
jgi:hypothetical protein